MKTQEKSSSLKLNLRRTRSSIRTDVNTGKAVKVNDCFDGSRTQPNTCGYGTYGNG